MGVICDCGTPAADCDLCGRSHLAAGSNSCAEEDEIERFKASAAKYPDKFILDESNDSLSIGTFNGRQVVWGCCCNKLRPYEDFIWSHRHMIWEYLKLRAVENLEAAQSDANLTAGTLP